MDQNAEGQVLMIHIANSSQMGSSVCGCSQLLYLDSEVKTGVEVFWVTVNQHTSETLTENSEI